MNSPKPIIDVAAGVLIHGKRFLLTKRPVLPNRPYGGYWEFPGGKIEPGETPLQALKRELNEEIQIEVIKANKWVTRVAHYPHISVRLHFFQVAQWKGKPNLTEHTELKWVTTQQAQTETLLPPNVPLLKLLDLPTAYGITNAAHLGIEAMIERMEKAFSRQKIELIQVRDRILPADDRYLLGKHALRLCKLYGGYCIYNVSNQDDIEMAQRLEVHGIHFPSAALGLIEKAPKFEWIGTSCHTKEEIQRAQDYGVDYISVSPIKETLSHPDQLPLGWTEFSHLIENTSVPVFALGGLQLSDREMAQQHGAHGIACLRGIW